MPRRAQRISRASAASDTSVDLSKKLEDAMAKVAATAEVKAAAAAAEITGGSLDGSSVRCVMMREIACAANTRLGSQSQGLGLPFPGFRHNK